MFTNNLKIPDIFTNRKVQLLIISLITLLGICFRFYNYANRIGFGADTNRDGFVALYGAKYLQLPLTGPFTSIGPFTTGPWYWYQLILVRLLFHNPLAIWVYVGLLSVLLIPLSYLIGKSIHSTKLGLIMALITALSIQQIYNASFLSNPSLIGIFSSVCIYLYILLTKSKKNTILAYLLGFMLGMTITIHYQAAPLLFLIPYFIIRKRWEEFIKILIGFSVALIPLLFFELTNHWHTFVYMKDYFFIAQYRIYVPNRWLTYLTSFWPNFWSFVTTGYYPLSVVFFFVSFPLFMFTIFRSYKDKISAIFLLLPFITGFIYLRYFRGERFFGYLQFFHPYIFLFTASFFYVLIKHRLARFAGIILLVFYITVNIYNMPQAVVANAITYKVNEIYHNILATFGNNKYSLYYCQGTDRDVGKGFALKMMLENKYDPKSNNKILYLSDNCNENANEASPSSLLTLSTIRKLPHFENIYLVSTINTDELVNIHAYLFTETTEYQSIGRWYFSEQP